MVESSLMLLTMLVISCSRVAIISVLSPSCAFCWSVKPCRQRCEGRGGQVRRGARRYQGSLPWRRERRAARTVSKSMSSSGAAAPASPSSAAKP